MSVSGMLRRKFCPRFDKVEHINRTRIQYKVRATIKEESHCYIYFESFY